MTDLRIWQERATQQVMRISRAGSHEAKSHRQPKLSRSRPLTDERCNYNPMIEYVTIRKLFNKSTLINLK
jgi:hypothetical protein